MEYVYECQVPLLTPDFCRHVIDKFEKDTNKSVGLVGLHKVDTTLKKTTDLGINPVSDPSWANIEKHLDSILNYGYSSYRDHLINFHDGNEKILDGTFKNVHERLAFNIQKYGVGDYFNWHVDDTFIQKRKVAFIMYLNTLSEGDGGKTKFLKGKNVRPEEGKVLFFPATWTYTHSGEAIKKGSKYIITGFIVEHIPSEVKEKLKEMFSDMYQ